MTWRYENINYFEVHSIKAISKVIINYMQKIKIILHVLV